MFWRRFEPMTPKILFLYSRVTLPITPRTQNLEIAIRSKHCQNYGTNQNIFAVSVVTALRGTAYQNFPHSIQKNTLHVLSEQEHVTMISS